MPTLDALIEEAKRRGVWDQIGDMPDQMMLRGALADVLDLDRALVYMDELTLEELVEASAQLR